MERESSGLPRAVPLLLSERIRQLIEEPRLVELRVGLQHLNQVLLLLGDEHLADDDERPA